MKETQRARHRDRTRSFHTLSRGTCLQLLHLFTYRKPLNLPFWVLTEASLQEDCGNFELLSSLTVEVRLQFHPSDPLVPLETSPCP